MEKLGLMPAFIRRPVAGQPWPICNSISGETDAVTPASAIIFSSSSANELQCTKVMVGPSSFFCEARQLAGSCPTRRRRNGR